MSVWVFVVILAVGGEMHYGVVESTTEDECNAKRLRNAFMAQMRDLQIEQSKCTEMARPKPKPGPFDDGDGPVPDGNRRGTTT
jgi:hypothetical protein